MNAASPIRSPLRRRLFLTWAVGGVLLLFANAVRRVGPIALEPLRQGWPGWRLAAAYAGSVGLMGFGMGYQGLHKQFAPRVVVRAWAMADRRVGPWVALLAPLASMGLVHGTRRRVITSWTMIGSMVGALVAVRILGQPWRGVIDAGVVVGLAWGMVAILLLAARAARGELPPADPELPAG